MPRAFIENIFLAFHPVACWRSLARDPAGCLPAVCIIDSIAGVRSRLMQAEQSHDKETSCCAPPSSGEFTVGRNSDTKDL